MIEKLSFKQWLAELAGTGAIYDPKAKGTFNWWGAPGSTGKVIEGDPIKSWTKKKKRKKKMWAENTSQLPLSTVTEQGITFKTGTPVTFKFMRGRDRADNFGARFQQDIEVAGRYMIHNEDPGERSESHWDIGEMTFHNPLVIKFNLNQFGGYDEHSWKAILAQHYGKTGKALSKAIRQDGYDGIVTTEGSTYTKEIIDISMF